MPRGRVGKDFRLLLRNVGFYLSRQTVGYPIPLLKDPIALLSSAWLARTFNMRVVAIIRRPAAFLQSVKRRQEDFDFSDLRDQAELMKDYLFVLEDEIRHPPEKYAKRIGLAWLCLNLVLHRQMQENAGWLLVRHEDLALRPELEFRKVFSFLQIPFTETIREKIINSTSLENPVQPSRGQRNKVMRNSSVLVHQWKQRLSEGEIAAVKEVTEPIASHYYSETDW